MNQGGGGPFRGGGGGVHGGGRPGPGVLRSALDAGDDEEVLGKLYDSRVMGRLARYMARVKGWLALGAAGVLIRTLAQLSGPYLVAIGTDRFIQTGDLGGLNLIALAYLGVVALTWSGQYMQTLYLALAGQSILYRLRTEMFDHLHRLSLSFFDRSKVGKLMSRVQNDVSQLQELVSGEIVNMAASLLTLIGIAVVMIVMNPTLALLTLAVVPVLILIVAIWQRYARRTFTRVRQAIATVNDQLQESISGVRVVQSLSREKINVRQFDNVNKAHLDANISAVRMQAMMMPAVQVLTGIAFSVVILFGGRQVLAGEMGIGILLGFLLYIQRFFDPVLVLAMQYTELQRSMASGDRIFELLDLEPQIRDNPEASELAPAKGKIGFNRVHFSYESGAEVLHNINLTIEPGETLAIVGPTGAGKSSLVNLVARFYEAERGEVTIDGIDVRSVTQESLRRQIGIVPQEPFLFSGSIEENIRYGNRQATGDEVVRAAKLVGAHPFITRLENGYSSQVGERGVNLSAGQRQLICLARAVLPDPPIMILDEATSSVDINTERIMQESVRRLTRGRTCLVIAHRLSTVTGADRIIVLENGSIVEEGSHRELLEQKGLYSRMINALVGPVSD